jgi:hypothetical protein
MFRPNNYLILNGWTAVQEGGWIQGFCGPLGKPGQDNDMVAVWCWRGKEMMKVEPSLSLLRAEI